MRTVKIAKELGIKLIGTIGIILQANHQGIIQNLNEVIELLENSGFRLSPVMKEQLSKIIDKIKHKL